MSIFRAGATLTLGLALTLSSGPALAQSWKEWVPALPSTPGSVQHDAARRMTPVQLRLGPANARSLPQRTVRVRVLAAADYRRQTVEWQSRARRLVDHVNALCRSWPAVHFEIVEIRGWDEESRERGMGALVADLETADSGDDVDLVVGLVAALPVFPGTIENLGMARYFSKHMVMRGLHDLTEYDELHRQFDTLSERERETLLGARKLHKEQVIFVHEWAHTLGLVHVRRPSGVMNPAYGSEQLGFDETEARFIEVALRHRIDDGPRWRDGTAAELRELLAETTDPDWDPRDRRELMALLTTRAPPATTRAMAPASAAKAPPATPAAIEGPLPDADRATLAEARALARADRYDEALRKLGPVETRHQSSPEVRLAVCELAWRHAPGRARMALAEAMCRPVTELMPREPRPYLYLTDVYLDDGDEGRALPTLARAEELLAGAADPEAWKLLALTLEKARLPTLAGRAAEHADPATAADVERWASALRRQMALPLDAAARGVAPEAEAKYIRTVESTRAAYGTPQEGSAIHDADGAFAGAGLGDVLRREAAAKRHHRR
jgi:hypothetical protein